MKKKNLAKNVFIKAFLFLFILNMVGGYSFIIPAQEVSAETESWADYCGWNCVSNDFDVSEIWLADCADSTNRLTPNSCNIGDIVNTCIWTKFNPKNTRYAITFIADLYVDSELEAKIYPCVLDQIKKNDETPVKIGQSINWSCGSQVELKNIIVTWNESNMTCQDLTQSCTDYSPNNKCNDNNGSSIIVSAPLITDFNFELPVCHLNTVNFTNQTTGGNTPYSYSWDFGDGNGTSSSENPSYTFAEEGTYNVTLTVTDSDSPAVIDNQTYQVTVPTCPNPCSDNDGDSYSPEGDQCGPVDCNDDDAKIYPRGTEACDGQDNDCDGTIDEDLIRECYTGSESTLDVGVCQGGSQTCSAGSWGSCVGEVVPVTELCDGLDNNCDGSTDEGWPELGQECNVGKGECSAQGVYVCD